MMKKDWIFAIIKSHYQQFFGASNIVTYLLMFLINGILISIRTNIFVRNEDLAITYNVF